MIKVHDVMKNNPLNEDFIRAISLSLSRSIYIYIYIYVCVCIKAQNFHTQTPRTHTDAATKREDIYVCISFNILEAAKMIMVVAWVCGKN